MDFSQMGTYMQASMLTSWEQTLPCSGRWGTGQPSAPNSTTPGGSMVGHTHTKKKAKTCTTAPCVALVLKEK